MKKIGQAAMEFLMTYGWAILVVLVAIGALAYFGVLSPEKQLPERCMLQAGVECADAKVTSDSVILVLRNGLGKTIEISNVSIGSNCVTDVATTLTNGDQATLTVTGCAFTVGEKMNEDLEIQYANPDTGLTHAMTGTLVQQVE